MDSERRCHAEASIELRLDPQAAWDVVMDWDRQSRWMLLTRVWGTDQGGTGIGGGVAARTSVGAVGFTDHMVITRWDPPRECTVKHLGKLVRGTGTFTITPAPATGPGSTTSTGPTASTRSGRSTVTWAEDVVPPLGRVGVLGWAVVGPGFEWLMRISLRRLVREVAG